MSISVLGAEQQWMFFVVRAAHEAEEESKLDDDMAINETESDRPNGVHA